MPFAASHIEYDLEIDTPKKAVVSKALKGKKQDKNIAIAAPKAIFLLLEKFSTCYSLEKNPPAAADPNNNQRPMPALSKISLLI